MKSVQCFAAHTDNKLRKLVASGDKNAKKELIKRGLEYDPKLLEISKKISKKISYYNF